MVSAGNTKPGCGVVPFYGVFMQFQEQSSSFYGVLRTEWYANLDGETQGAVALGQKRCV